MPAALGKIWLLVSMLLGGVFVRAITQVYQIETVPTWYNGYTTVAFFMTVLLSGPLILRKEPHVTGLALGLVLVLAGEIIGRGLFYGLHMTVGMAVAG